MPIIKANHLGIHYQEMNAGAGDPVLMIHGMFSNLAIYYFNIAPLIARHHHVVMYDMKGHGLTEKTKEGYGLRTMTDDLLAFMDAMRLKTVHLAGYSYGGLIALKMALRCPERIKKLAIIEAPDPSDRETLEVVASYSKEILMSSIKTAAEASGRWMGKRQLQRNFNTYDFIFNETSVKADMRKERDFLNDKRIDQLQQDTLLIYGKDSNCNNAGNILSSKIRNSELILMQGDHNIPMQQPTAIARELSTFFHSVPMEVISQPVYTVSNHPSLPPSEITNGLYSF